MDRLKKWRPPSDLAGMAAWAGEQHRQSEPDTGSIESGLLVAKQGLEFRQPPLLFGVRHLR